jgi:prephenate dehydratase
VLRDGVEDQAGNETRFVWLAQGDDGGDDAADAGPGGARGGADPGAAAAHKTAIVFWGAGTERPGWLVACLSAFAERGVNLTRIESRPRRSGLGSYMFFVDLEGRVSDPHVRAGMQALREHTEVVRVIGSFPAARP